MLSSEAPSSPPLSRDPGKCPQHPSDFDGTPLESLRIRSDLKTYSHPCNFVLGKLRPRQETWPTQGPHIWLVSKPRPYLPVPGSQSRVLFICFSIRIEHHLSLLSLNTNSLSFFFPSSIGIPPLEYLFLNHAPKNSEPKHLFNVAAESDATGSINTVVHPCLSWFLIAPPPTLSISASQSWLHIIIPWWALKKYHCLGPTPGGCNPVVRGGLGTGVFQYSPGESNWELV